MWAHWGPTPQCGQFGHTGGPRHNVDNLGTVGACAAVRAMWAHWEPTPQCGQSGHTGGLRRSGDNLGTLAACAAGKAMWAHWEPMPQCGQFGHTGGGLRRSDGELGTTLEWGYAAVWVILGHWGRTPQC